MSPDNNPYVLALNRLISIPMRRTTKKIAKTLRITPIRTKILHVLLKKILHSIKELTSKLY